MSPVGHTVSVSSAVLLPETHQSPLIVMHRTDPDRGRSIKPWLHPPQKCPGPMQTGGLSRHKETTTTEQEDAAGCTSLTVVDWEEGGLTSGCVCIFTQILLGQLVKFTSDLQIRYWYHINAIP